MNFHDQLLEYLYQFDQEHPGEYANLSVAFSQSYTALYGKTKELENEGSVEIMKGLNMSFVKATSYPKNPYYTPPPQPPPIVRARITKAGIKLYESSKELEEEERKLEQAEKEIDEYFTLNAGRGTKIINEREYVEGPLPSGGVKYPEPKPEKKRPKLDFAINVIIGVVSSIIAALFLYYIFGIS